MGFFGKLHGGKDYFSELANNNQACLSWAEKAFQAGLRRELARSGIRSGAFWV